MKKLLTGILYFLIGLVLFVGLPLIVWGIPDIRSYFDNLPRTIYAVLMTISTLLSVILVPPRGNVSREGERIVKKQKLTVLYLQVISLLCVVISPLSDRYGFLVIGDVSFLRYLGLIFTFIGYFFMNWSVMVLGKQFSVNVTIQKGHELITRGPYRFIRHPRYLGIILFLLGISLTFRSLISLFFVLLLIVIVMWRISDEEKLLRDEFTKSWDNYANKTWRLIPFLY